MLKKTVWKPDSCGCVIEYSWNDQAAEADRVHEVERVISACPAHQGLSHKQVFSQVITENRGKNEALAAILKNMPAVAEDYVDDQGNAQKRLKAGFEYAYSFDQNRKLQVDLKGLPAANKPALQQLLGGLATVL